MSDHSQPNTLGVNTTIQDLESVSKANLTNLLVPILDIVTISLVLCNCVNRVQ